MEDFLEPWQQGVMDEYVIHLAVHEGQAWRCGCMTMAETNQWRVIQVKLDPEDRSEIASNLPGHVNCPACLGEVDTMTEETMNMLEYLLS